MAKIKKEQTTIQKTKNSLKKMINKGLSEKQSEHLKEKTRNGGIKKEYLKSKDVCRVTLKLPKVAAPEAQSVCIVGNFNDWNIHANPMKKMKNGDYATKLDLEPGREHQFRYLVDGSKWLNDWNADKYVKTHYGDSDNSVVLT